MTLLAETLVATVIARPAPTLEAPQHLCLDAGYDNEPCRQTVQEAGLIAHIRSRKAEQAEKKALAGYKPRRWVVERTLSWINRFRKLLVRFEKLRVTHYALLCLSCAYITFKRADLI
jgi:putative transposase